MMLDPVTLEVFKNLILAIPEEMGANLKRTAFSSNIKERMDESCALFDATGRLIAQAEHIPVHLGAMPSAIKAVIDDFPELRPGDQIIVNDPYRGGSHLPDITLIAPFFWKGALKGFAVNRAHHADVGGITPGSMPGTSNTLNEEGIIIPPTLFAQNGKIQQNIIKRFFNETRNPYERMGDLSAQMGANTLGIARVLQFIERYGIISFDAFVEDIIKYSERRVHSHLCSITDKIRSNADTTFSAMDFLESKNGGIPIKVTIKLQKGNIAVDFTGTSPQIPDNLNTPLSVTKSSVYYVVRCLLPADIPPNHGCYSSIRIFAPEGSLLNPRSPAPVSSGNVETSQRIVDVLLLAFSEIMPGKIPAQGQGTMNNVAFGWEGKTYYETIAGGMGATAFHDGASGVQVHMTNTANTPIEALENSYPIRIQKTLLRKNSGGSGIHKGGNGIIREYLFLEDTTVSIQSERRIFPPKGIEGGNDGKCGLNLLRHIDGRYSKLPGRITFKALKGETLVIETPGGGGWGKTCAT